MEKKRISKVVFQVPKWVETLDCGHWLKQELLRSVKVMLKNLPEIDEISVDTMSLVSDVVKKVKIEQIDAENGQVELSVQLKDSLYYEILSEMTGMDIQSEYHLISIIREMAAQKQEYDAVAAAVRSANETGYGVIVPGKNEIKMEAPVLIRQGNRYGVKIKASSPSVHLIRAEVETEIAPIVGSESQAEDLIAYIKDSDQNENGGWNTLIFGKSVEQMIEEGIRGRVLSIGTECQQKLQDAMKKIVNKSGGRLIFIII